MFKVLYDFMAEDEGELTVSEGEVVQDCTTDTDAPEGWILVESAKSNKLGFVPRNYIEELPPATPVNYVDASRKQQFEQEQQNVSVQQISPSSSQKPTMSSQQKSVHQTIPSFLKSASSTMVKPNENVFSVPMSNQFSNHNFASSGGLSRSSSNNSLHSLGSTTGHNKLTQSSSKQSLFSVVQTAKLVSKASAKFSVNQVPVVPVVKAPPFAGMVERENYGEAISSTNEYFEKLGGHHSDSYSLHVKTLDEFAAAINQNMKVCLHCSMSCIAVLLSVLNILCSMYSSYSNS